MNFKMKLIAAFCLLALLTAPAIRGARASVVAGGVITGTVTDQKGAVVTGAAVTVADEAGGQASVGVTDGRGRYKIEGLTAGNYTVKVSAQGFREARQENVKVEEEKSAALNFKLEIAPIETETVTIKADGVKANADPVYSQIRKLGSVASDLAGDYASVNNLVLKRDAGTFTLKSGELYFLHPVEGRLTGAVFVGEGEFTLTPPTEEERKNLAIFVEGPSITEGFTTLVMRFSDLTFDEVKASANAKMGTNGPQAEKARGLYRDNQTLLRKQLRSNADLRTLVDLLSTGQRPGYFSAFINGRRFSKLIYEVDPLGLPYVSPEQVALTSHGTTDGGIWTAFHMADEYRRHTATSSQDRRLSDITRHEMDAAIKGTRLAVTDRMTLKARSSGSRVLPFALYPSLRVSRVQDEQGNDLNFIQEGKDEDGDFAIIWPQPLQAAKAYKITVQYDGEGAIKDYGDGNFALVEREGWYPNSGGTQFGDRATFDMTFRYPKGFVFVATGAPAAPATLEGDVTVSKWTSGTTELAVAGFNYGKFKVKQVADKDSGYNIEFYANTQAAPEIKSRQSQEKIIEMATGESIETLTGGAERSTGVGSTTAGAGTALEQTQNSMRIYNAFFGKLAYTRLAMTQQPFAFFGQSWPTLVYMPYTAFMNTTERAQLFNSSRFGADTFWEYVGPHEIAHQWWGHSVGWTSYRDQWMSEGFAEFSASLYIQYVRLDPGKFIDFWEDQRKLIVEASPETKGRKPYTVGPVTLGYRLNTGKTGGVARRMIYPKGAYILHMLRMLMWDTRNPNHNPDERFQAMMHDFVKTYYNRDASTDDFKRIVDKHTVADADIDRNKRMDWFFNEWVYGTEVPSYVFDYQLNGNTLSGRITQAGVSDGFVMRVPLYADFGKGWVRLGAVTLNGSSSFDLPPQQLPLAPKRVAIIAFKDVLAVSVENNRK